jgi:hypothetical protein
MKYEHEERCVIHVVFHRRRLPMARTRAFLLFIAVLLALSGCKAFFDFNAFSSLDKAGVPNPSRYQGADGLANLQSDLESKAIVDALRSDFTTSQQIKANLVTDYTLTLPPPPYNSNQQTAAILYSDLSLASTYGDDLVNNVAALLVNPPGNIASILQSIIPPQVSSDPTKFANMVQGLIDAYNMYKNLGNSTPISAPGMNLGDVAQKAAVAYLMYEVDQAVVGAVAPGTAVAEMFKLTNNQPNTIPPGLSTSLANPLNPLPVWLKNIFDAAGAPYPA